MAIAHQESAVLIAERTLGLDHPETARLYVRHGLILAGGHMPSVAAGMLTPLPPPPPHPYGSGWRSFVCAARSTCSAFIAGLTAACR